MNRAQVMTMGLGLGLAVVSWACVADTTFGGGGSGEEGASAGAGGAAAGSGGSTSSGAGGSGGGHVGGGVADPAQAGPFAILEVDTSSVVPATGEQVAIHVAYPDQDDGGPFPVVLVGHGFNLPPSQYYGYVRHLASHGFVAMTVDFQAGFTGVDHVGNANELLHGLTWASEDADLAPVADVTRVGTTGHSLGGKIALLAATLDDRVKASITLDPVDGGMSCSAAQCPDVSALLPLGIPTAFIGETTNATGSFQACAPAAENFDTFYATAGAPSLRVEVLGANHMSFLDDVASCGFTCNFCNAATLDNGVVNGLSRSYVAAFFGRHLLGEEGYDLYLTGSEAQARYVTTGLATIDEKP